MPSELVGRHAGGDGGTGGSQRIRGDLAGDAHPSMMSGVATQGSAPSFMVFLSTYSGRTMWLGTGRRGETTPGAKGREQTWGPLWCPRPNDAAD